MALTKQKVLELINIPRITEDHTIMLEDLTDIDLQEMLAYDLEYYYNTEVTQKQIDHAMRLLGRK